MCTWKGYNEIYSKLSVTVPATNKVKLVAAARLNIFFLIRVQEICTDRDYAQ